MPIQSRKPNLYRDEVDYLTDDPFVRELDERFGKRRKPVDPIQEDEDTSVVEEFSKGFSAGIDQTQALGGGA